MLSRIWIAIVWVGLLGSAAGADAPAVRLQGTIQLDGKLGEPDWAAAAWQSGFSYAGADAEGDLKPAAVQTRFKVLFDDDALYVAIESDEPDMNRIVARCTDHDQDTYTDDSIELFMDPAGEGRYYQHFVINSKGAWYDDSSADYGLVHGKLWNCPLQVGTSVEREAGTWTVEVRIPFAALPINDQTKNLWLWNVTRNRLAGGASELSSWSPLRGSFHQPRQFGRLAGLKVDFRRFYFTLGEPKIVLSGDGSGYNRLALRAVLHNTSPQARKVLFSATPFGVAIQTSAPPVALAAGASEEVAVPPFTVRADIQNALVQLTVSDADTGAWIKTAVKRLDTEYKPVTVDLLQPVYRQNIYATQNISNLLFRVTLAPDAADVAEEVEFFLQEGQNKPVRSGKAALSGLSKPQALEVGTLPTGVYTLKLCVLGKDHKTLFSYDTTVRKLSPAPGVEVRVDDKRNILINGKPVVFIGWYGEIPLEDPRPDVVSLQNIQTPVTLNALDLTPVREAWKKGIYSFVSIEPGRLNHTFSWWQDPGTSKLAGEQKTQSAPSEEFIACLRKFVEAVQNEPGVIGYYLTDEPEINDHRSDYLEAVFRIMQELDPYRPVMITNDTLDGIVTHGYRACDILSPDPYSNDWNYVPSFLKRVLEVAPTGKATMLTPWASSGQAHTAAAWGSAPPYSFKVMRNQALVSVCLGSRGWTGYTSSFFMEEPVLRYGLPYIWREMRFLEPAMADPQENPLVESDTEVASWLGRTKDHLYLIVVNHKPGARAVTVRHPLLAGLKSLDVVSGNRSVEVLNGTFTDTLTEGDAFVYTTDPAGRNLATTGLAEADIAARVAACVKPGNLLHSSLGVRARASEGYFAPWFTQYYYYAINGVEDDRGWHLSHTDKPGWLELALPKERSIGRVVVHSPNLKDFDLQFQSASGDSVLAEIRENTRPVIEVTLPSRLPTLKLRITALATRSGTKPDRAQVREIEAYEQPGTEPVVPVRKIQEERPGVLFVPPPAETRGDPVLWRDDFSAFFEATGADIWKINPGDLLAEQGPGGGLILASAAAVGYAGMSRSIPYDKDFRYFQVKIRDLEPRGYRWIIVSFGSSSGRPGYRGGVHTIQPGVYTIDTHSVNEGFRTGAEKTGFLFVGMTGSQKRPDGTVEPGARGTFDWMQLVRRPVDGLVVTLADGSPLPESLKQGDTLLFRLFLETPAIDVTVETLVNAMYQPIPINAEPYVQLRKVGTKDGRAWAATVKLGPGTGTADGIKCGYPVMFRAMITGGAVSNSMMNAWLRFE